MALGARGAGSGAASGWPWSRPSVAIISAHDSPARYCCRLCSRPSRDIANIDLLRRRQSKANATPSLRSDARNLAVGHLLPKVRQPQPFQRQPRSAARTSRGSAPSERERERERTPLPPCVKPPQAVRTGWCGSLEPASSRCTRRGVFRLSARATSSRLGSTSHPRRLLVSCAGERSGLSTCPSCDVVRPSCCHTVLAAGPAS